MSIKKILLLFYAVPSALLANLLWVLKTAQKEPLAMAISKDLPLYSWGMFMFCALMCMLLFLYINAFKEEEYVKLNLAVFGPGLLSLGTYYFTK